MKKISPMELTTLLNRTKVSVSKLTVHEHRLLSFLLARVNKDRLATHGYLAWPGTDEIIDYTDISKSTIERLRKTLVAAGWVQYTPGHGAGSSNHYYINGQRIYDAYVASGNKPPEGTVYATNVQEKPKKQHERNKSGLKQGKVTPVAQEVPKVSVQPVDGGYPRWHKGVWVTSAEHARRVDIEAQHTQDEDCPF
jgi:DNA-binding MarR family transcriptional regulator